MQKVNTDSTTGKIENLLQTMAYNEAQLDNFDGIEKWISKRNGKLESLVGGNTCSKDPVGAKDEFQLGEQLISICYLEEAKLKEYLEAEDQDKKSVVVVPAALLADNEKAERLSKLKKLVGECTVDLCAAESLATFVPQSQLREFDQPSWSHQIVSSVANDAVVYNSTNGLFSCEDGVGKKIVLVQLSREGYSLEKMLPLLTGIVCSDEKFILVMNSRTSSDASCLLPFTYLVDALNKSKIRKWPIDLLFLDRSLEINLVSFLQTSKNLIPSQVFLWGDLQKTNFPTQLYSGVLGPSAFGARAHFILDSLADVQTTVDSIVAEVWSSGVRVNHRIRSVVFVHQPIYKRVIDFLEKKIATLKTSGDLRLKSNDFVKRTLRVSGASGESIERKKIQNEGVKIFPDESDFCEPTLLYEIGTSCDIMASSSPNLGHLLFVISYRNSAELFSLANNYGEDNEVFIHSTNLALIKEIATNIKARQIWVNSNRRSSLSSSSLHENGLLGKLFTGAPSHYAAAAEAGPTKAEKDEFARSVLLGEKALKAWSSIGGERKHSSVVEAFLSVLKNESSGGSNLADTDRFHFLSQLMRVAGRIFNEESGFMLNQHKPYGITALVLTDPELLSIQQTLIPILLALLKGNVVLVISLTKSQSPYSNSILNTFNSIFPVFSVQFIQSNNISTALQLISHPGKVSLLWLIHSGQLRVEMNQIPFTSFNKIIVSHAAELEKSTLHFGQQLEITKKIFL